MAIKRNIYFKKNIFPQSEKLIIMHPARPKAEHRQRRWTGEAGQGSCFLRALLSAHIGSGFLITKTYQVFTCYCCEWLLCILGWLLQAIAVKSYHVFLPQVGFQKRKPQIDGSFLNLIHMYGQENSSNEILGYYRILLWLVTMYSRLVT